MSASYPNRVCTCGYRRFRERRTPRSTAVQRWMLYDTTGLSGFGTTPFGTFFGSGSGGLWGLFDSTFKTTVLDTVCESCQRVRSTKLLGGIAPFATYVENGYLYVIASDVGLATCFALRFTGPGGSYEEPLAYLPGAAPPPALVSSPPPVSEAAPPPGAVLASSLLRARLPQVEATGQYVVELVDRCCGCDTALVTVTLEAPPMLLSPLDADLGGAPRQWLFGQYGDTPGGQPASGSRVSIPFDKCAVVHEYDARFGTPPSSQGWTHGGAGSSGDYALVEGGALRGQTAAASYWSKTTVVPANPLRCFSYAVINPLDEPVYGSPGDGVDFDARYATALSQPYQGVRYTYSDRLWHATELGGSSDVAISPTEEPRGWTFVAATDEAVSNREQTWLPHGVGGVTQSATVFGSDGTASALDVVSVFGDTAGGGTDVLYRNYVASYGGRFIRPMWQAFAQVTNPVLRLYLVADANSSVLKTARFRVRYGQITGQPYALPANVADATLNFVAANTVYELPIALPGLTANLPFVFTVERLWDHGDDGLEATAHLLSVSVRSL